MLRVRRNSLGSRVCFCKSHQFGEPIALRTTRGRLGTRDLGDQHWYTCYSQKSNRILDIQNLDRRRPVRCGHGQHASRNGYHGWLHAFWMESMVGYPVVSMPNLS